MKTTEYARMAEYEQTYWWHVGRLEIIRTYLRHATRGRAGSTVLNVGCGTGGTIAMLEGFGRVDNIDASSDAIEFVKKLGHDNVSQVVGDDLPFADRTYDVVGAFDVLEHIEDDLYALREWKRVLRDDGAIVLTVPAYPWLWSDHDVSLHHKRRYTMTSLLAVAAAAGLRVERRSYAIAFSLPLVVGFRFAHKLRRTPADSETSYVALPGPVNALFTTFLKLEARLHRRMSLPAGTSIVTVLRKNDRPGE